MSWPDDHEPRFIVTSVEGSRINPRATKAGNTRRAPGLSVHVLDRAYCHRIVRSYETGGAYTREKTLAAASVACDHLNRRDEQE